MKWDVADVLLDATSIDSMSIGELAQSGCGSPCALGEHPEHEHATLAVGLLTEIIWGHMNT